MIVPAVLNTYISANFGHFNDLANKLENYYLFLVLTVSYFVKYDLMSKSLLTDMKLFNEDIYNISKSLMKL